jgi:hypothetical protein
MQSTEKEMEIRDVAEKMELFKSDYQKSVKQIQVLNINLS